MCWSPVAEQPVVVPLFESIGTGSFTPTALHFSSAGLQFSSLVNSCEYKWLIFTCLKPESRPHIFDMACVPMAPRPCTSSFRQNKVRALLSGLKQILHTSPFLFPPAYATGPLLGSIFSAPPPQCFSECIHVTWEDSFIARFSQYLVGWVWMPFSHSSWYHDVHLVLCCS